MVAVQVQSHAPRLTAEVIDGLGRPIPLSPRPQRIVSLVPSLTEALFGFGLRDEIVGRTEYCVQPAALVGGAATVGGTKTPDIAAIIALEPDLVIASAEENTRAPVEALIAALPRVYVSLPLTVRRALAELSDLARLVGVDEEPTWLTEAEAALAEVSAASRDRTPARYFCPIWRRPYMVAAPETYMSDLLQVCGGVSIFGAGAARYYPVTLAEMAARRPDVVLLPDEPYPFVAKHVAEIAAYADLPAVRDGRIHLLDGQLITWYGPRIASSLRAVAALLEAP